MKIAVTGGLGFIGSNFILYEFKNYKDVEIINVDKETYASNRKYLAAIENDSRYRFVKADISRKGAIEKHLKDVDIIVNFAAESHVDRSISDSTEFVYSNYIGVKNLLEIARDRDIRLHQISTDEVFGSLPLNSKRRFNEKTPYNPRNPYSATKAAADHLVSAFQNTYGVKATISYSGNNYGPHQHPEKLIPKTILSFLAGRKITLYGRGNQVRDWVYVEDHCSAIDLILRKSKIGRKFIVSSGSVLSNREVIDKIKAVMNIKSDSIDFVTDRPGHDLKYQSDSSLIRKELGWSPRINFDKGIRITVKHYVENPFLYVREDFENHGI